MDIIDVNGYHMDWKICAAFGSPKLFESTRSSRGGGHPILCWDIQYFLQIASSIYIFPFKWKCGSDVDLLLFIFTISVFLFGPSICYDEILV
jgi:hypothetical protein